MDPMPRSMRKSWGWLMGALSLAALVGLGCAPEEQDPIVIALEGRTVPLSEIVASYDRIHGPNHWRNDDYEARKEFVELVAKKELLVQNAREYFDHQLPPRESMMLDRWLEKNVMMHHWPKVRARIDVPQSYIDSLAAIMTHERYIRHVVSRYEADAQEIYDAIQAGGAFEATAQEYAERNPESIIYADVGWVNRPQLDPAISGVLFDQLTEEGDVGGPVETQRYGWHVIQLGGVRDVPIEDVRAKAVEMAENYYRTAEMQKLIQRYEREYAIEILDDHIDVVAQRFNAMHDSLNMLKAQGIHVDYQGLEPPVGRFTADERALPLVRWSGGVLTIGDFLDTLWKVDLDYWPTTGDAERIRSQIQRRMTRWMLMKEATEDGALEDPELLAKKQMREDELFLDAYYNATLAVYRDQVSETDVRRYWESHEDDYVSRDLVGYGFIRFPADLRDLAWRTYEQLQGGTQFPFAASEARKVDQRVEFEAMLDPTSGPPYPQITAAAMAFAPKPDGTPTITEPLQVGNEWVILRVYFRKEPNTLDFEEAAPFVKRDLQRRILEDSLAARVDELESRFALEIDYGAIR